MYTITGKYNEAIIFSDADDIDAFEKGYFVFKFRFAPDENA